MSTMGCPVFRHVTSAQTVFGALRYCLKIQNRLDIACRKPRESPGKWLLVLRLIPPSPMSLCKPAAVNSTDYTPGTAGTDGESPEWRWSSLSPLGRCVQREMSPGHRIDAINYHFSNYRIRRTFGLGTSALCLVHI